MPLVARPRRFVPVVLLAMTLSACGGPDLGKQNFPRTTVTQTSGATAPDGPIDDDAVSLDAQRMVDPCAILDGDTVSSIGTPVEDGLSASGLDECSIEVTDAGGKKVRLRLQFGYIVSLMDAIGAIEGLPVYESKPDDGTPMCFLAAMTDRESSLSIGLQTTYEGGDPCGAGMTALREIVVKMHDGPPKQTRPANSVVPLDPCTLADDAVATEVLGRGTTKKPTGLHDCNWYGGNAQGDLRITETVDPTEGDDGTRVDLGGGLTGYQKEENRSSKSCTIVWKHLPTADGEGEIVKFEYTNYHDDAGGDDACGKARRIVDTILPKLPKT
ncbi:hypothetical protein HNR02_000451 [Amycolatopsis endophytica]|uniref:DUF3558 domain-containing protein n=1 Tax=Amycolatopsis endophytica TaxID=860233 RepID=A0A853AWT8_9PSEU|nr:DUF3558 domain-containing protein [Amycolatopsis endophytica]NYI87128.1 hypothetical protein [Amycolatopsis endophytica]